MGSKCTPPMTPAWHRVSNILWHCLLMLHSLYSVTLPRSSALLGSAQETWARALTLSTLSLSLCHGAVMVCASMAECVHVMPHRAMERVTASKLWCSSVPFKRVVRKWCRSCRLSPMWLA